MCDCLGEEEGTLHNEYSNGSGCYHDWYSYGFGIQEVSSNIIVDLFTIIPQLMPNTHASNPPPVLSSTPQVPTLHFNIDVSFNTAVIGDHLLLMQVVLLNFVWI